MRSPKCAGLATAEAVIEARDSEQLRGRLGDLVAPHEAQSQDRLPLADLAARIQQQHEAATNTFKRAVAHAITAGELLLEAKKQLRHGKWLPWLGANCEIPERTVQAYMRLARLPIEKRNAVADLPLREALSAIRSREQKLADAEAIKNRRVGPARFCATTRDGDVLFDGDAVRYLNTLPPPPPPPPPSAEDMADELVRQLDQTLYEVRNDVDVMDVRRAIRAKLANENEDDDTETKAKPRPKAIGPIDRCTMAVRSTVLEIMREMDAASWDELFVALRDELADLEKVAARRKLEDDAATSAEERKAEYAAADGEAQ
jgi:Protein of unknown function (DUF3102)